MSFMLYTNETFLRRPRRCIKVSDVLWDVDEWDIPQAVDECEIPVRVLSPKCYSPEELTQIPKCFIPLTGFLKSRLIWNLADKWTTFYVTSQNDRSCICVRVNYFYDLRFDFGIVQTAWWVCLHFITDVK